MEKPRYITGYTTEEINRDTELNLLKITMRDTKASGILLSFSLKKKNEKDEKSFKCKYIDYKDLLKNRNRNFKDRVLMMNDIDDFHGLLANVYYDNILILNSEIGKQFGGLGNRDEDDTNWENGSFVIWNYDCIVDDEQDKGKQNQQQNQQPKNQEQKNNKQMRTITTQIKTLNTQIQEAINKTQDSQIKNSITEKTRLIAENVDKLISILTGIQSKYILPNIIQDPKIPDEEKN